MTFLVSFTAYMFHYVNVSYDLTEMRYVLNLNEYG